MIFETSMPMAICICVITIIAVFSLIRAIIKVRKGERKVNNKQFWTFIIILAVLKLFDIVTTKMFVGYDGIEQEANALGRDLMNYFGVNLGLVVMWVFAVFIIIACFYPLLSMPEKSTFNKIIKRTFIWGLFIILLLAFIFVVIWNTLTYEEQMWLYNNIPVIKEVMTYLISELGGN